VFETDFYFGGGGTGVWTQGFMLARQTPALRLISLKKKKEEWLGEQIHNARVTNYLRQIIYKKKVYFGS
jgi:hypothetical protein